MSERLVVIPVNPTASKEIYSKKKYMYNLTSNTSYEVSFLEYNGDINQRTHLGFSDKKIRTLNENCFNWDVQHVPWIGKHIAVVREGNKAYFNITKSPDLKRIDLMNY
jgi:hypothetical protein